jgi:hypothetical protein
MVISPKFQAQVPNSRLKKWLEGQSFGRQPMGDADVVVTGHWHHLRAADWGGVMWLQAPALDGGSLWWKEMTGASAETGILTFCMYPDRRLADMAVL